MRNTQDNVLLAGPLAGARRHVARATATSASAKLTYSLTAEPVRSSARFLQDPRDDTGAINDANHTLNGDPLTYLGRQDFGGRDYALRYDGVVGTTWLLSAQVARHREKNSVGPATSAGDAIAVPRRRATTSSRPAASA